MYSDKFSNILLGALAGAGAEAGAPTGTALAARESAQALMVGEGAALFWGGRVHIFYGNWP